MEEQEKTREDLIGELNELTLTERTDLLPEMQDDGGSSDMLIGAAVGAGAAGLIAAGMWLWNRHKRKKAEKIAKKEKEAEFNEKQEDLVQEAEQSEEEEEAPKKDK